VAETAKRSSLALKGAGMARRTEGRQKEDRRKTEGGQKEGKRLIAKHSETFYETNCWITQNNTKMQYKKPIQSPQNG